MTIKKKFKSVSPYELNENPFQLMGKDWFLLTAGKIDHFNTMTGGWGMMGILWRKAVVMVYVRPTRHTYGFTEKYDDFTLCFFEEKHRDVLNFCGTKSGRDTDKAKECGLTPMETKSGSIWFSEARLVIACKKIYSNDVEPALFLDPSIDELYPLKDYHKVYTGEVTECLIAE